MKIRVKEALVASFSLSFCVKSSVKTVKHRKAGTSRSWVLLYNNINLYF